MYNPHHYEVAVIDSKTSVTIKFTVYGVIDYIKVNGNKTTAIVNEYNTPLFIKTINTIGISKKEG